MTSLEQAKALMDELIAEIAIDPRDRFRSKMLPIIQKHMDAFAGDVLEKAKLANAPLVEHVLKLTEANRELLKDKEVLDKLLRPHNWLGIAEVNSVKGSATWHLSQESVTEFYNTDPHALHEQALDKTALAKDSDQSQIAEHQEKGFLQP